MTVPFSVVQLKHDVSAWTPVHQHEWMWIIKLAKQTVMQNQIMNSGLKLCFAMLFKQLGTVQLQHSCTTFGLCLVLRYAHKAC